MENNTENNGNIVKTSYTDPITGKFKVGNPGRPEGVKNKPKFLDELEEMLDEIAEGKDYSYRKALKKQVLKRMIIDGDTSLLREYWQQRDGKPTQRNEHTGADGNPIQFEISKEIAEQNDITRHTKDSSII